MEVYASHIHARYPTHATLDSSLGHVRCVYGTFTLCSAPFQVDFYFTNLGNRRSEPHISPRFPKGIRFVLFRFRSPLITESHLISIPPPTKMLQFGGFPFPGIFGNDDLRQEVLLGDLRIQGIHAPHRRLSQLVTTFISSRAEPSPSQVVASFCNDFSTLTCVSPLVSRNVDSGFSDHPVTPAGRDGLHLFPAIVKATGVHF